MSIEVTILAPNMEPVAWPEASWEDAEEAVEEALATGEYDHGEVTDTETNVKRYFYRETRVVWEVS